MGGLGCALLLVILGAAPGEVAPPSSSAPGSAEVTTEERAPTTPSDTPPIDRDDEVDAPAPVTLAPDPDARLSLVQREGRTLALQTALTAIPMALLWLLPGSALAVVAGVASLVVALVCPPARVLGLLAPLTGVTAMAPGCACWPTLTTGISTGLMQWRSRIRGPWLPPVLAAFLAGQVMGALVLLPPTVASLALAAVGALVLGGLAAVEARGGNASAQQLAWSGAYVVLLVFYPVLAPGWLAVMGLVTSVTVGLVGAVVYRVLGRQKVEGEGGAFDLLRAGRPPTEMPPPVETGPKRQKVVPRPATPAPVEPQKTSATPGQAF
ncbi:MAG: hypothetical protein AB2A00_40775 [Myxococcota bacterium]